jgi:hypothetical protein
LATSDCVTKAQQQGVGKCKTFGKAGRKVGETVGETIEDIGDNIKR